MHKVVWVTLFAVLLATPSCTSSTPTDSSESSAPRYIVHEPPVDRGRSEERSLEYEAKWDAFAMTPHDNGDALVVGVRALAGIAVDYLSAD